MYNIDFKVNSSIISLPVCPEDSISDVIKRMQRLQPFNKLTQSKIEQKLHKCLQKVTYNGNLKSSIQNKLKQLITSIQDSQNRIQNPLSNRKITNKQQNYININNTLVNILQQSSAANISYLTNNRLCSQKKLIKKYDDKKFQHQEAIQCKLKYKYGITDKKQLKQQKQNVQSSYHHKKSEKYPSQSNYKRMRFSNEQTVISAQYAQNNVNNKSINSNSFTRINNKYQKSRQNGQKTVNRSKNNSYGKQNINGTYQVMNNHINNYNMRNYGTIPSNLNNNIRHTSYKQLINEKRPLQNKKLLSNQLKSVYQAKSPSENDSSTYNQNYFIKKENHSLYTKSNQNQRNTYNPVPKLNELIQRSKSLGQIVQKEYCPNLKDKYNEFNAKYLKQRRQSVGKIHHHKQFSNYSRPNLNDVTEYQSKIKQSMQNYKNYKQRQTICKQRLSYSHTYGQDYAQKTKINNQNSNKLNQRGQTKNKYSYL